MRKKDLHDKFIEELHKRNSKRAELINQVSDILKLEKESVYRRMAGKVNFSIREMGILAKILNISLDSLLYQEEDIQWLPFILETPLKFHSIDTLCDMIDLNFKHIEEINRTNPARAGMSTTRCLWNVFIHSPLMMKFMFFKWGYYFVQPTSITIFPSGNFPLGCRLSVKNIMTCITFNTFFIFGIAR